MNVPVIADIGELLGEIQAGLVEEMQKRLHRAGFTDTRESHDCVFRHLTQEGVRLRDLASSAELTPQGVGEHVDALERLGYVERVPDPADRRAKLIRPTERGSAFMRAGYEALAEIEGEWTRVLGPQALPRLRAALARVRAVQREGRAPA
jgi:DNA-binding MarR family transcriptional regulator